MSISFFFGEGGEAGHLPLNFFLKIAKRFYSWTLLSMICKILRFPISAVDGH